MLLYIHIPFCDSKCYYCAFNSYADKIYLKKFYMNALLEQIKFELDRFEVKKKSIETIFIGGGTPSTIDAYMYEDIFTYIKPYLSNKVEVTTEANPNSATEKWLQGMNKIGINRISFGVQSFNDKKLKYLGRNHSAKVAINAIENAKKVGIVNLSLDLIHGVQKDNKILLKRDLDVAFSLPINHISTYHLSIEKRTKFDKDKVKNRDIIEEQRWFYEEIEGRGFKQYEISNFGKYICKHNLGYWKHKNYIGVGAGAVGFLKDRRFYPHKRIDRYIKDPLFAKIEILSKSDIKTEKIFLGLRSVVGIKKDIFSSDELSRVNILLKEDKLFQKEDKLYNNDYLLSDEIALFILSC